MLICGIRKVPPVKTAAAYVQNQTLPRFARQLIELKNS